MDRSGRDQTPKEAREDSSDPLLPLLERMARPPEVTLSPGTSLGRYRVVSLLDRGGMGEVYRAHDERLGRDVAIKVVRSGERASPALQKRFETEAKAVGGLNHPNVVAVFDAGEENGCPYLVTELLEGETLAQRLRKGALAPAAAVEAALSIARALEGAHAVGVVHRDLKPANVFVTADGRIKVLNFGLAKLIGDRPGAGSSTTESGAILGTAGYMSPEQVRAQPADPRSDIFSFGAILYEMLSGSGAFKSASAVETGYAILNGEPTRLPAEVPTGLARIVERCLAKKPDDRFQSAREVIDALASTAVEPPVPVRLALVLVGIGLLAAAPGLLYYFVLRSPRPPPASEQPASIAVVPFVNMSSDQENEYFSDGVTEELINALANIPGLRVASRTSVFALKGRIGKRPPLERNRPAADKRGTHRRIQDIGDGELESRVECELAEEAVASRVPPRLAEQLAPHLERLLSKDAASGVAEGVDIARSGRDP